MEPVKHIHHLFWNIKPFSRWKALNLARDTANVHRVTALVGYMVFANWRLPHDDLS